MATITGLNSVSIFVEDYRGTVDFYVSKLGFAAEEQSERATMLRAGDFQLLVHVGGPPAAPPNLGMHLHLWVNDVDAYHDQLVERGVQVPGAANVSGQGSERVRMGVYPGDREVTW